MKKNIILQGDCIEILKTLPDNSIDLIFADPPYWMRVEGKLERVDGTDFSGCQDDWDNVFKNQNDYNEFTYHWLKECYRVLKNNGSFWVIGGMQCIYTIGHIMQNLGFWFINDVIWHKSNPTPNFKGTRLNNSHETLIWATKSKKSKYTFNYKTAKHLNLLDGHNKQMGSIWKIPVCSGNERLKDNNNEKLHSTQKPENLLYRIIAISSKKDDLILDPFGGTMTTAAVAKKMKRNFIMIEKEENYINYGLERLSNIDLKNIELNENIINATYDIKPLRVTMSEMIENGYFFLNEKFYLDNNDYNEQVFLLKDGKLLYNHEIYDMHTLAAKLKNSKANRLNGFDFWKVIRNNKLISIDEIRNNYRNFLKNKESNN